MSDYFLGEIRLFAFNFAPSGWLVCDGTQLQIQQYQALYALIGVQFGGNATTTFNLPDMRGRTPVHYNPAINDGKHIVTGAVGSTAGSDSVTLTSTQLAIHTHSVNASNANGTLSRGGTATTSGVPATAAGAVSGSTINIYVAAGGNTANLAATAVTTAGAGAAHENRQPYLAAKYCISTNGIFPSRP